MTESTQRPDTGGRLMLCADAFLYTGVLFMLIEGGLGLAATLGEAASSANPPVWMEALGPLAMLVPLVAGVLIAWFMHGHGLHGWAWLGMLAGILLGGPLVVAGFFMLFTLGRFIPNPIPAEGPWGLVIVLVLAVIAFLVMPVVDAARDLTPSRRAHTRLDWLRFAALAIIVGITVVTGAISVQTGSEIGELGVFMVPFAAAGACAVLGADLIETWRARRVVKAGPIPQA